MKTFFLSALFCIASSLTSKAQGPISVYVNFDEKDSALVVDSIKINDLVSTVSLDQIPFDFPNTFFNLIFAKNNIPKGLILKCEYATGKNSTNSKLSTDAASALQPLLTDTIVTGFGLHNNKMNPNPVNGRMIIAI